MMDAILIILRAIAGLFALIIIGGAISEGLYLEIILAFIAVGMGIFIINKITKIPTVKP